MNPRAFSGSVSRILRWAVPALLPFASSGQIVETAYLLRLEIAAQTGPSTLETAGAAIIMGLDFSAPVPESLPGESSILLPTGSLLPLYFDPQDRTTATTEFLFDTRSDLTAFAPSGTYQFSSTIQPGFTGAIDFPAAGYPPTPRITNFAELQSFGSVKTATVRFSPVTGSFQPDDVILVGVVGESGEEIYSSPDPWDPDALSTADGTAILFFPPGQVSIGTIIVMRQTASTALPGNAKGLAGYGVGTGFPIVSTGPRDQTAPVITARVPAIGAYAVDPNVSIQLTFDEPMRSQGYLDDQSFPSNALQTSTWSSDRRSVTIDLPEPLSPGPITLIPGNAFYPGMGPFVDLSGNPAADGTIATSFFVGREPFFRGQPNPLAQLTVGSELMLSTDVIWPGQILKYQWIHDGSPIPGATTSSLSDSNFQIDDSGLYELKVENEFGTVTSLPALVVPDLDSQRLRYVQIVGPNRSVGPVLKIPPGSSVQLSLDGILGSDPKFQWRRNGIPLTGQTGTTLTLPSATPDLAGVYDLLATNAYGSAASNALSVRVTTDLPLPTAPTIHQDRSVVPGGWLYLASFDQSAGLLIRKWTHDGEDLPIDPTPESLQLLNIQAQEAGVYAFTVSNGTAVHTTVEYTVTLRDPDRPFITDETGNTFFTEDSAATIGVTVEGKWPFTYKWFKADVEIPGKVESVIALDPGKPEQAGVYKVTVSNAYGSVESRPATVRYLQSRAAPSKPRIVPPTERVIGTGDEILHFSSESDWSPAWPREYQWKHDGEPIVGATDPWLAYFGPGPSKAGSYTVVYRNEYGESESDPVTVRFISPGDPPEIIGSVESVTSDPGAELWLHAPVIAPSGSTMTWYLDGRDMSGEVLESGLPTEVLIRCLQPWHAGSWTVTVTSGDYVVSVPVAQVTTIEPGPDGSGHLANVSTRAVLGEGNTTLIAGFVIEGSEPMHLLIRGIATGMQGYLGPRAAGNSRIKVIRDDGMTVLNENWIRQDGVVALHEAAATAGAFPLDPWNDDAAIVLDAGPGRYTVLVHRASDQPGIGLAEVYDLEPGISTSRVVNLSSRVYVGAEDERAIPGFVIGGSTPVKILARAIGPGLEAFDVSDTIADPQMKIVSSGSIELLGNDNWEDQLDPLAVATATDRVGAFALDSGSLDSAILATLPPGLYSIVVASADGTPGVALVEIYEVPAVSD